MDFQRAAAHCHKPLFQQHGVGDWAVCDGGGGGAVHDDGDKTGLSEWSWPSSNLQEIPCPVLQGGCSQEDFNFFRKKWLMYVRYYEKVDVNKMRDQLLN